MGHAKTERKLFHWHISVVSHDCFSLLFAVSVTLTYLRLTCPAMKRTWWLDQIRAWCGAAITFHACIPRHDLKLHSRTSTASLDRRCDEASWWHISQVCCDLIWCGKVVWWLSPVSTTRVDGWPVSITRQLGPCWRARVSTSQVDGPSTRLVETGL